MTITADGCPVEAETHWMLSGAASGQTLVLDEPLSFWGGFDSESGRIIDQHHPQVGQVLSGRIVLMRFGRGSSSASSVIAEAIRTGTAPAAIVMSEVDEIVALGAIAADELYGTAMPVVVVDEVAFDVLAGSEQITIEHDGVGGG